MASTQSNYIHAAVPLTNTIHATPAGDISATIRHARTLGRDVCLVEMARETWVAILRTKEGSLLFDDLMKETAFEVHPMPIGLVYFYANLPNVGHRIVATLDFGNLPTEPA